MLTKATAASRLGVDAQRIMEMAGRGDKTVVILDDYRKFVLPSVDPADDVKRTSAPAKEPPLKVEP